MSNPIKPDPLMSKNVYETHVVKDEKDGEVVGVLKRTKPSPKQVDLKVQDFTKDFLGKK